MPINSYGRKPQTDALTKIAQALQIAQSTLGIPVEWEKLQSLKQEQTAREAEQKRISDGVLTPKEAVEGLDKYNTSDTPTQGGIHLKIPDTTSQGGYRDVYATAKGKAQEPVDQKSFAGLMKDNQEVPAGTKGAYAINTVGVDGKTRIAYLKQNPSEASEPKPDQFKAAGFAKRIEQAESVFGKLADSGYNRATVGEGLSSILPGAAKSPDLKMQEQAERNFVNAVLRRESGSAISKEEFSSAEQQYFPRPGDDEDVLKQKAANRAQVFANLKAEGGSAYARIPSVPSSIESGVPRQKGSSSLLPNAYAGEQKKSGITIHDTQALQAAKQALAQDPNAMKTNPGLAAAVNVLKQKGLWKD
jgi:hypothetical protein